MTSEPTRAQQPALSRWSKLDWVCLGGVTAVAAVLRAIGLTTPPGLVFDEFYYGPDACRYVRESAEFCGFGEFTFFHPPVGKWMISFGIQMFGPNRLGWRAPAVFAGVLMVVVLYVLGRRLLGSTVGATTAAGLLTFDPLHFVQSRLAMLDIYLALYILLAATFAVLDRDDPRTGLLRPWGVAAGVAAGLAVATKWSAAAILIPLIALAFITDTRKRHVAASSSLVGIGAWLIIVPLVAYTLTYAGRVQGDLLAVPWAEGSWLGAFAERQIDSLSYHTETKNLLDGPIHPYSSPAWTWPLVKRPMAFFFAANERLYAEIIAIGNPLVWIAAIGSLLYLALRLLRAKTREASGALIVAFFAAAFLPWTFLSTGGPDPYIFYLLPAIPFMCLGLAWVANGLWARRSGRIAVIAFGTMVVAVFAFFYPLLTAKPIPIAAWERRIWFRDCRFEPSTSLGERLRRAGLPIVEQTDYELPPGVVAPTRSRGEGWCWI